MVLLEGGKHVNGKVEEGAAAREAAARTVGSSIMIDQGRGNAAGQSLGGFMLRQAAGRGFLSVKDKRYSKWNEIGVKDQNPGAGDEFSGSKKNIDPSRKHIS